jgi:hypothetical protein
MKSSFLSHNVRHHNPLKRRHHLAVGHLLPPKRAALGQPRLATSGLASELSSIHELQFGAT